MKKLPQVLNKTVIAKTRVFTIEELHLKFENSTEVKYERIFSPSQGAVLIVPQLDAETIILIREYCAGVMRYEIAFPKGRVEIGEEIIASANREIMEETGYGAHSLEHIRSLSVSPGYMSHQTHIVYATDLYQQRLEGDEPEPIEVLYWKLDKLDDLLDHAEFTEARSIAALYILKDRLARKTSSS